MKKHLIKEILKLLIAIIVKLKNNGNTINI
jgi:hypothetical protein